MNKQRFTCILLSLVLWLSSSRAARWECNIYDYQYDMTVIAAISINGRGVSASDAYELAAFCGDECRGVATVETIPGTALTYYYLRVRSNVAEGETITFKCYDTAADEEIELDETLAFSSLELNGSPSFPLYLSGQGSVMMGDVNGDGRISIADSAMIINYILGLDNPGFIESVADMNGDGRVSIADEAMIINVILGL